MLTTKAADDNPRDHQVTELEEQLCGAVILACPQHAVGCRHPVLQDQQAGFDAL